MPTQYIVPDRADECVEAALDQEVGTEEHHHELPTELRNQFPDDHMRARAGVLQSTAAALPARGRGVDGFDFRFQLALFRFIYCHGLFLRDERVRLHGRTHKYI